jgi:hypothetical protein
MMIIPILLVLGSAFYIIRRRKKAAIEASWRHNFKFKIMN